ncbi:thiopurine S-methyltransferase [Pseudomonas sp. TTU2014-080ASC]|uniref:thiopurine S-methyltransferase n=1 Tax=Pseudomonas sp. TTU2014-080ASC TaxID=1729724 RepID=UPI0007188073|nr:thiopurine S-methyltransferase [Pseudomonas sp. TTU2014-080ASC]KRW61950.1 thiopurine S-methyltransferase [Pseudomonas sp. TTU2014-080ASC]
MDADFWHRRWERSEIGFHQGEVNAYLQRYWSVLDLQPGAEVLVPLCGKSLDLLWLAGQGFQVVGVELSQVAIEDFFKEQKLSVSARAVDGFKHYSAGNVQIYCGDFFALEAQHVQQCRGFYDRAALIALPPPMRERYVQHLSMILPQGCKGLLVSLDYPQEEMPGPPFAVSSQEADELFAAQWELKRLLQKDVLGENWRFLKRGLTRLEESVYSLCRR